MNLKRIFTQPLELRNIDLSFNINPIISKDFLVNAFFFFALMPYVSPLPLGSDVQIVSGLIGYLIIGILLIKDQFIVSPRDGLIFFFSLFFICYLNLDEPTYQFRKAIGPLFSFGVYFIAKTYKDSFKLYTLDAVLVIYLAGAITQYISPGLFNLTFENFIRVSKYAIGTGRGITSLSTEPGFLGIICVYILIIQDWYYLQNGLKVDRKYYLRLGVAFLLIILSKSGSGYILLFLYSVSKVFNFIKKYWFILLIVTAIGITFISKNESISGNKGLSDLVGVLRSTSPSDLLRVSSFANRVNPIIVGVTGAIERPFGRGNGSFTTQAREVYLDNGIDQIYPPYMRDRLYYEISNDSVSTFGKYIFEYGIFFLIYLFLVMMGLSYGRIGIFTVFLVFTGLLFSLPIVYPPTWLIFGFFDRRLRIN